MKQSVHATIEVKKEDSNCDEKAEEKKQVQLPNDTKTHSTPNLHSMNSFENTAEAETKKPDPSVP